MGGGPRGIILRDDEASGDAATSSWGSTVESAARELTSLHASSLFFT